MHLPFPKQQIFYSSKIKDFADGNFTFDENGKKFIKKKTLWEKEQEGHDGPVSLHWLIRKIPSYQTLQYLGIALKHKTPKTGLKLVAKVLIRQRFLKISV